MKAYELPVELSEEGKIELPHELLKVVRASRTRMLLLIDSDEEGWAELTQAQFAAGYAEADSIYDTLE